MKDPVFGGGHLSVSGSNEHGESFSATVDDSELSFVSAGDVEFTAGNSKFVNTIGGSVTISAGDGTNVDRGQGGNGKIKL